MEVAKAQALVCAEVEAELQAREEELRLKSGALGALERQLSAESHGLPERERTLEARAADVEQREARLQWEEQRLVQVDGQMKGAPADAVFWGVIWFLLSASSAWLAVAGWQRGGRPHCQNAVAPRAQRRARGRIERAPRSGCWHGHAWHAAPAQSAVDW